MSDLHKVRSKTTQGAEWRGTIRVTIDEEEMELTVRQLTDPEFFDVMSMVDRDELEAMKEQLPSDKMDRLRELQEIEEPTDEEAEEREELQEELDNIDVDMFEYLSKDTFMGIQKAAILAVEPDEEDLHYAVKHRAHELEDKYDVTIKTAEDAREPLNAEIEEMIRNSTNFTSFIIGVQALTETVGNEGN